MANTPGDLFLALYWKRVISSLLEWLHQTNKQSLCCLSLFNKEKKKSESDSWREERKRTNLERENKKKYDFWDGSTFVFFPLIFSLFLCFVGWKNGNHERDSVNEERRISKFLGREAIIMIE